MKQKPSKAIAWFDQHNRRQLTFMIAIALIAILFVAALIGILSGRYKPFADSPNTARRKMAHTATLQNATLDYKGADGSAKSTTGNSRAVTVKALAKGGISLQGVGTQLSRLSGVSGKMSVTVQGTPLTDPGALRNLVWNSTTRKSDSVAAIVIDSDTLRSFSDAKADTATFTVIVKPNFFLATQIENVADLRTIGDLPQARAGDLTNDNKVDYRDFGMLVSEYDKAVADPNNPKDLNKDGTVNYQDFAIMVSNYDKTGATL